MDTDLKEVHREFHEISDFPGRSYSHKVGSTIAIADRGDLGGKRFMSGEAFVFVHVT